MGILANGITGCAWYGPRNPGSDEAIFCRLYSDSISSGRDNLVASSPGLEVSRDSRFSQLVALPPKMGLELM